MEEAGMVARKAVEVTSAALARRNRYLALVEWKKMEVPADQESRG